MQLLKDRIRKDGKVGAGNVLKVDSFLNHQMDIQLFDQFGKEFKKRFADKEINKILRLRLPASELPVLSPSLLMCRYYLLKRRKLKILQGKFTPAE